MQQSTWLFPHPTHPRFPKGEVVGIGGARRGEAHAAETCEAAEICSERWVDSAADISDAPHDASEHSRNDWARTRAEVRAVCSTKSNAAELRGAPACGAQRRFLMSA